MKSSISFTSALLAACTAGKPSTSLDTGTTDTVTDTSTVPPTDALVLGIEGTLFGRWSERVGHALAFLEDGRLLIGAPSFVNAGVGEQEDDLAWVVERDEGLLTYHDSYNEVESAIFLDDPWTDPDTSPEARNQFGQGVVSTGDVTGDGVADIAVASSAGAYQDETGWNIFSGPDYKTARFPLANRLVAPRAAACGDLDGDGIAELCTANGIYFGPLAEGATLGLSWPASAPLVARADLDGDSLVELVVSDAVDHAVYHLVSLTRAGGVTLSELASTSWSAQNGAATALATADLDGDGSDEVIAGWTGEGDDVVLVGLAPEGGDVFAARTTLPVRAEALATGDFDGDGQDDLAVGGASEVTIWTGPLAPGLRPLEEAKARYRGPEYPDDQFGYALATADTDGDGFSELVIGAPLDKGNNDVCSLAFPDCASGRVWWLSGGGL